MRLSARGDKAVSLEGVTLLMPLRKAIATYALGMRFRGGRRPPRLQWEWRQLVEGTRKFQRGDHALWLGEVDAGVQLNLKGEEAEWEVPFGMEGRAPPNWNGAGGGTVSVVEEGKLARTITLTLPLPQTLNPIPTPNS